MGKPDGGRGLHELVCPRFCEAFYLFSLSDIYSPVVDMGKMMLVSVALFALAQSVSGQTSSSFVGTATTSKLSQPSGTSSSVRPAATYKISVGTDHKFSPDITQALVGDLIRFDFMPLNHSVVRAE